MLYFEAINSISDCTAVSYLLFGASLVGAYKITTFSLNYFAMMFDLFLLPAVNFKKYGAKSADDNWAVVTGASDGIGKEYALQLAKKGLNVLLISRTLSKLELIAADIESKYKVKTKVLAFDASTDESSNYVSISEAIAALNVTVLVNNVGQSHSIPVPFLETADKELRDIITINNIATLKITQAVVPQIVKTVEKSKKIRGLVLTMGSFGGLLPTPYLATYSGSKAFLQSWSNALSGELEGKKIDVELVISYLVTSSMSKIRRTSFSIPNPRTFVASVLRGVGRRNGAQERYGTNTPYFSHALMHFFIENTVGVYSKLANKLNFGMHKSIRVRALKKQARLAKQE